MTMQSEKEATTESVEQRLSSDCLILDASSPSIEHSTRQLTSDFVHLLLDGNNRLGYNLLAKTPSNTTTLHLLEQALELLQSRPGGYLDLQQEVPVKCGHMVRHTVLSAAYQVCIHLEPATNYEESLSGYWKGPNLGRKVFSKLKQLFDPAKTKNDPRGRHFVQANLWREILKRQWVKEQPVEQEQQPQVNEEKVKEPLVLATITEEEEKKQESASPYDSALGGDDSDTEDRQEFCSVQTHTKPLPPISDQEKYYSHWRASVPAAMVSTVVEPVAALPLRKVESKFVSAPPLLILALSGFVPSAPSITELIEQYHCNPNDYGADGLAPLHFLMHKPAISNETRLGFAQRLVESKGRYRCNLDLPTSNQARHTALHLAAREKDANVFIYLLEKGADPQITNHFGVNPMYSLATNVHSYTPYRPDRLERVLKYILDRLDEVTFDEVRIEQQRRIAVALFALVEPPGFPAPVVAAETELSAVNLNDFIQSGEEKNNNEAEAKEVEEGEDVMHRATTNEVAFPPSPTSSQPPLGAILPPPASHFDLTGMSPTSLSGHPNPPARSVVPPGLYLYARTHIYELLDSKLNAMLAEKTTPSVQIGHAQVYRRPSSIGNLREFAFRTSVGHVIRPIVMAELDTWMIPDLAKVVTSYLI